MHYVLWIDDEPARYNLLCGDFSDTLFIFACGVKQINHYLNHAKIKWDLILLDHDMGSAINGMEVCKKFLGERGFRVACVSNNTPRRLDMIAYLKEYAVPVYDISVTDTNFSAKIIQLLTL
ncbi:MAG: hypothetical protein A2381_15185 [Bdellovibrionales bacterium RIFOXYB1_FULL_37_110]|nr:MAG: hypothetical protein A2381_15185 [Bdellovibrionales bacterium RIFOXYB1_FULL_37_110]